MLLVLSEEHKEHLGFLTRVDVEGRLLRIIRSLIAHLYSGGFAEKGAW